MTKQNTYTVEVTGLVTIEAESKEAAITEVKQQFEDEKLTWEDLYFICDEEDFS